MCIYMCINIYICVYIYIYKRSWAFKWFHWSVWSKQRSAVRYCKCVGWGGAVVLSSKDTGPLVAASQSRSAVHIMYLARTWGYSEYSERGSQTQDLEMRNQDFRSRKIERGVFLSIFSASFDFETFCEALVYFAAKIQLMDLEAIPSRHHTVTRLRKAAEFLWAAILVIRRGNRPLERPWWLTLEVAGGM